jgi:hypothetical protein
MPTLLKTINADEARKALYDAKNYSPLVDLLNAPGSGTLPMLTMSKNDFIRKLITPATIALLGKSAEVKAFWKDIRECVFNSEGTVSVGEPDIQGLLAQAIADGILTQHQITAATTHTGLSLAEVAHGKVGAFTTEAEVCRLEQKS